MSNNGEAPDSVLEQIKKLMNLADNNPSEAEAASASAKAQELMDKWNLSTAEVERAGGKDGKREDAKVRGGFYKWQREMWRAVAELHFCMYWTQDARMQSVYSKQEKKVNQKRHRLVGRVVNTTATQHMATYLEEVVEREVVRAISGMQEWNNTLRFSNWATSFRKGMSDRLVERLEERRRVKLAEARSVDTSGASTSRALTLVDVLQMEEDANNDFLYGEGWSAARREETQRWAEESRLRREAATAWAAANPEEAAAKKAAEAAASEAYWKKNAWRWNRGGSRRDDSNIDRSAYRAGSETGGRVSLDGQVGGGSPLGRIGR